MTRTMTINELGKVAGGSINETYEDSVMLAQDGYIDKISWLDLLLCWEDYSAIVDRGWRRASGITSVTKPFGSNQYFIGRKEITRQEALKTL